MPIDPRSDNPGRPGAAYQRQLAALTIVRDVYGGTLRMREAGDKYLPKFPLETDDGYKARKKAAVLYNAYKRTVGGLTGLIFRKDPEFSDEVPEEIVLHAENIDLAGRTLDVWAHDAFENAEIDGHTFGFVDMQPFNSDRVRNLGEERAIGSRPYWINILKQDLLSWRVASIAGRTVLTQVVWRERIVERDGQYGEKEVERLRVYRLAAGGVAFTLYRQRHQVGVGVGNQEWVVEESGTMSIDEIPLFVIYTNRTGYLISDPPLLDLAYENILHYQTRSDRGNTLHVAGVPIPVLIGIEEDRKSLGVGSDMAILLPKGGDAKYLEPAGVALDASRQELLDIERRMAVLGLSMLMSETRSAETATSKRIDKSESDSQLASAARGLEDGLNEGLRLHAKWLAKDVAGKIHMNRDFIEEPLDPQIGAMLSNMVGQGQLSLDTMWEILVQGEILPASFDPEQEQERLASVKALMPFLPGAGGNGKTPPSEQPEPVETTP